MAKCEEGYRCQICGEDVESIAVSDLYLRYVIGEVDPEQLHQAPERHIVCNPVLAQFIHHDDFPAVMPPGPLAKANLDHDFVAQREQLVTRGWLRLQQLAQAGETSVLEYPLPEAVERYRGQSD